MMMSPAVALMVLCESSKIAARDGDPSLYDPSVCIHGTKPSGALAIHAAA